MSIKKIGAVAAGTVAGMFMLGGIASAAPTGGPDPFGTIDNDDLGQVGLVNLNNTDILHNVNAVVGVCDNNVNVLGVQVPVEDVANGLNVPILSPGVNGAVGEPADLCATGGIIDGGTNQHN